MRCCRTATALTTALLLPHAESFAPSSSKVRTKAAALHSYNTKKIWEIQDPSGTQLSQENNNFPFPATLVDRRAFHSTVAKTLGFVSASWIAPVIEEAKAAVGTLPEYADTNAVIQGITVNVADTRQFSDMVEFLREGFGFDVLRQSTKGSVTTAWLGFGPEQMSIPSDFEIPVSGFGMYGGHAALQVRCDVQSPVSFYDGSGNPGGNNIAYLQVGVPGYRISQMMKYGGNILSAYGFVDVVSPSGLPVRSIVGIWPDPIMFVALNCVDVKTSRQYYEALGFTEQEYPYARPSKGTGQFEPAQPKGSVYLSQSPNSMGVLLLPTAKKKEKIIANPAFQSLNIVYKPSDDAEASSQNMQIVDPSDVPISFTPYAQFKAEEEAGTKALKELVKKTMAEGQTPP